MSFLLKILSLVYAFSIIIFPSLVTAHVVKSDKSIGAVLHIDPDDDPIAGEKSTFFFDIKDKSGRFQESNCKCKLIVKQSDIVIYEELFNRSGGGTFSFPERGVYSVSAVGEPISGNTFTPFELSYNIRVERGVGKNTEKVNISNRIPFVLTGVIASLFLFIFIRYKIVHSIK